MFDLSILEVIIRLVTGLVIGFVIALTGVGAGVLVVPALTLLMRLDPSSAVGTAGFYALLTKLSAAYEHYRLKTIHFEASLYLLLGAAPATAGTAALVNYIRHRATGRSSESLEAFQSHLTVLVVGGMALAIGMLIYQLVTETRREEETPDTPPRTITRRLKCWGVILGAFIGFVLGSTAISGVLIVPVLALVFKLVAERIVGSAIFVALVLTLILSAIYGVSGQVNYVTGLVMAVGSLGGVRLGSRLSVRLPDRLLKAIVTGAILVAAAGMMLNNPAK